MCRQRAGCNAGTLTVQAKGGCNPGAAKLTARGLGGSCREEAMQQLEECKGGGRWREGFGGL